MQIDPTKLVEARQARAMSQEEAAIAADLSSRTIQRIEAGHEASLESTKALLTIFGADIIFDQSAGRVPASLLLWRMLLRSMANSAKQFSRYCFDGFRFLLAATFALVALAKPLRPNDTGLFVGDHRFFLGAFSHAPSDASEILGYWIMPLMLIAAVSSAYSIGSVRRWAQLFRQ